MGARLPSANSFWWIAQQQGGAMDRASVARYPKESGISLVKGPVDSINADQSRKIFAGSAR